MSWVPTPKSKVRPKQFALKASFLQQEATPNGNGKNFGSPQIDYPFGFTPINIRIRLERTGSSKHKKPLERATRLKVELLVSEQQMGSPGPAEELARVDSYVVSPANPAMHLGETNCSLTINWHSAGSDDRTTYFKNSLHYKAVALCRVRVSAVDSTDIQPFVSNRFRVVKYKLHICKHPPGIFFNAVGGKQKMTELQYRVSTMGRNGPRSTSYNGLRLRPYLAYQNAEQKFMPELNTPQMFKCSNAYEGGTGTLKFRIGDVSLKHKKKLFVVVLMPDLEDVDHYQIAPAVSKPVRVVAKPLSRKVLFNCIAGISKQQWTNNADQIASALRWAHLRDAAMMRQGNDDILELQPSSTKPAWRVTNIQSPDPRGGPAIRLVYSCKLTKEEAYLLNPYNITALKQSTASTDQKCKEDWVSQFTNTFARHGFNISVFDEPKVWDPFRLRKIGMQDPSEPPNLQIKNERGATIPTRKGLEGFLPGAMAWEIQQGLEPLVRVISVMNSRLVKMEQALTMLNVMPPNTREEQIQQQQVNRVLQDQQMRSSRNAVMPFPGRLPTGISTTPNAMLRKRPSSGGGVQAAKRQRTHNSTRAPGHSPSTRITIDVPTILNQTMPPPPKVEDLGQFGHQNPQNTKRPILRIKIPSDSLSRQKSADRPESLVTPQCLGSSGLDTGPEAYRRNLLSPPGVGSLKRETSDGSVVLTPTMEVTGNGFHPAFMPRTPMQTMTTQPASITREDLPGIQNIPGPALPGLQDLPSLPKQEGMKSQ